MKKGQCELDDCFLCRHCMPEWKEVIAVKKETLVIRKGKYIFSEGEPVKGIFFINEGAVKVTKNWGGQKEIILRFAKAGDVIGLRGYGADSQYPVSAVALEDTKICFVDSSFLEVSLSANVGLTRSLMQLYASELQKAEKRMRDLAHRDVKGRIAQAVFEIAEVFGADKKGNIPIALTRQDIASYAGTTYETVFKFFAELSEKKILSTEGKRIRVNSRKALESYLAEPE